MNELEILEAAVEANKNAAIVFWRKWQESRDLEDLQRWERAELRAWEAAQVYVHVALRNPPKKENGR